jgi:hypothetical protein
MHLIIKIVTLKPFVRELEVRISTNTSEENIVQIDVADAN